jgi:hypothetical protein
MAISKGASQWLVRVSFYGAVVIPIEFEGIERLQKSIRQIVGAFSRLRKPTAQPRSSPHE